MALGEGDLGTPMAETMDLSVPGVSRGIEGLDVDGLRRAIQEEYALVAAEPDRGFHFHTGRRLAAILVYDNEWLDGVPEATIASFAGTGNPFSLGRLMAGEHVVDVGCGAGIDSIIAAKMVGATGSVIGVDMTPAMVPVCCLILPAVVTMAPATPMVSLSALIELVLPAIPTPAWSISPR